MRRVGDLMRELGFNPEAPEGAQKAFVRHLVRAANEVSSGNSSQILEQSKPEDQLSFDLEVLGVQHAELSNKKTRRVR